MKEKIGVGIITYNREKQFKEIVKSIDTTEYVDHLFCLKDGGTPSYSDSSSYKLLELTENKGVAFCKNLLIDHLLKKDCEHIFILEDDCLVIDNNVWDYCISFSKESGLLHFNWNDYRYKRYATAEFIFHKAALCHNTEANFSYFHKIFLENISFDEKYMNAWEHIDLEMQAEQRGFIPPFRTFISPSNLSSYLKLIDDGESTITGKGEYQDRVINGHHYFQSKWGKSINEIPAVSDAVFYEEMKKITIKYGKR